MADVSFRAGGVPSLPPSPQSPSQSNTLSAPAITPALTQPVESLHAVADNTRVAPVGGALTQLNFTGTPTAYGTLDAHFQLQDLDGIDQKSKGDLTGTLDLDLELSLPFLKDSLKKANQQVPDLKLELKTTANGYRIDVTYPNRLVDISLGSVRLTPQGGALTVDLGGLGGAVVSGVNLLTLGNLKTSMATVVHSLSKDMGFAATVNSSTSYTLQPDLKNSPLFQEIPLAGGETLTLESVKTPQGSLVDMGVDAQGNLTLAMKGLSVVASSDGNGKRAIADKEGVDQLDLQVNVDLKKDLSLHVESLLQLDLNIQPNEREALRQRLKNVMGQDLPLSGQLQLKNLSVSADISANGKLSNLQASGATLDAKSLQADLPGGPKLNFSKVEGALGMEQQGSYTRLSAEQVEIAGQIKSDQGTLNVDRLSFGGTLVHDKNKPQQVSFEVSPGEQLNFSGSLQQGGQRVSVQNLSLKNAQLSTDMARGKLSLQSTPSAPTKVPEAQIKKLTLPDVTLYALRLKGSLETNLNTGALEVDAKAFGTAAKIGDITVNWLQASGNIQVSPSGGVKLQNAHFSTTAQLPELTLEKLSGRGDMQLKPNGDLVLQKVKGLELETSLGLDVKGDFKGGIQGTNYTLQTLGPANIDYVNAEQDLDLKDIRFQGEVKFNGQSQHLQVQSSPGQWIEMKSGRIQDLDLKDIRLQGAFDMNFAQQALVFSPGSDGMLRGQGTLGSFEMKNIQAEGPIQYDIKHQRISWADPVSVALPQHGIPELQTTGSMQIETRNDGVIVFHSENGSLSGKLGDLTLKDLQVQGEVIFNPKTQHIQFSGEQGMKVQGEFNGYQLDIQTSGELSIEQSPDALRIQGKDIRVNGLLEGFTLTSPEGLTGSIALKPDFSGFVTEDLQMGFAVDDLALSGKGSIRSNKDGLQVRMSGSLESNKTSIESIVKKLSQRKEFDTQAQQSLTQVTSLLNDNFAQFASANVSFEDLLLQLTPDLQLQGFEVKGNGQFEDVKTTLNLEGKKTTLPLGTVDWQANVEGSARSVSVPSGTLSFALNDDMRHTIVEQVKQKLEDSGFKDVVLSMGVDGKVQLDNATFKHKKLSIKTELALTTRIVDNQLEVSLDKLKLKNVLFNAVAQMGGVRERVADEVDKMLSQQEVKFNRRNRKGAETDHSGHIFRLDLQALLQQVDPKLQLSSAQLSPTGKIELAYGYNTAVNPALSSLTP